MHPHDAHPPDHQATIVDDALLRKGARPSRVIIGGVAVPIGVDEATKDSLKTAAQKRREKAERRRKRLQPVKNPLSFEVREARKERRHRELQDAYAAIEAWSLRPITTTQ